MYRYVANAHILPFVGSHKLSALTPLHLPGLYRKLQKEHGGRKALSMKSIRNIHGILHKALGQAVRWNLITLNPADRVEPPKPDKPQIQSIGVDEMGKLLAVLESAGVWRLPILIAAFTGLRRGEVLALTWGDYDEQGKSLAVCHSLSAYSGSVSVKSTKTEKARVVLLPEVLIEALNAEHQRPAYTSPDDYICCYPTEGRRLSPKRFSEHFTAIVSKLNLPITLHGLRHTHASLLIAAGVPLKIVSERLGHSQTSTTAEIYAHVSKTMQQQAVDVLDRLHK